MYGVRTCEAVNSHNKIVVNLQLQEDGCAERRNTIDERIILQRCDA
jgi:hypothetical protein